MDRLSATLIKGETLLHSLLKSGVELAHDCGGTLACSSCFVLVRGVSASLGQPSDDELDMLDRAGLDGDEVRLACQVIGSGEVLVEVRRGEAPSQVSNLPVAITDEAVRFLSSQLAKHPGAVGMRFAVAPAGCTGLRYRVDPIDTVQSDDVVFECGGVRVAVDPSSLRFVQGTTMRLEQEGLARRLRFDNPNAARHCGCGESFGT